VSGIFEFVIIVIAAWLLGLLFARLTRPSEPVDSEPDDYAGNPVRVRPRPKPGTNAIARVEPDDGDEDMSFPPLPIERYPRSEEWSEPRPKIY
jgi:hypothetical protein